MEDDSKLKHSNRVLKWRLFVFLLGCIRFCTILFFDVTNDMTAATSERNLKNMT